MSFILFYNKKYIKKTKKVYVKKTNKIKNYIKHTYIKNKYIYNEDNFLFLNILLGSLQKKGHKIKAYNILCNTLFLLKKNNNNNFFALYKSLNKIKPNILLFNKKRGTSVFELPRLLSLNQEKRSAVKWLIKSKSNWKKGTSLGLSQEINKILLNQGDILKKKERIINTSLENRPFFYLLKR